MRRAFAFAVAGARDIHLIVPRPFALEAQRLANLLRKPLQAGMSSSVSEFPYRVNFANRLRQRIDLSENWTLIFR